MTDKPEPPRETKPPTKLERVEFKVTSENKLMIRRAAGVGQEEYSAYVRRVCLEHARNTCKEHGLDVPAPNPAPEKSTPVRSGKSTPRAEQVKGTRPSSEPDTRGTGAQKSKTARKK